MVIKVPDESWLKRTNQLWKFWIFASLMLISASLILLEVTVKTNHDVHKAIMILGVIGFSIPFLFIKCPGCRKAPIYKIMRQTSINTLTQTILTFRSCPYCGHDGDGGESESDQASS